jgi:prolyl-tRNA synthetase
MAAAIEANYDDKGIRWPLSIAPYEVVVIPVNMKKDVHREEAKKLYEELLQRNFEVVIDDREESAGYKFNEADLIGFPVQVIVGEKMERKGTVEVKLRRDDERIEVKKEDLLETLERIREELA